MRMPALPQSLTVLSVTERPVDSIARMPASAAPTMMLPVMRPPERSRARADCALPMKWQSFDDHVRNAAEMDDARHIFRERTVGAIEDEVA